MTDQTTADAAREAMEAKYSISATYRCDVCTTDRAEWMRTLDAYAAAVSRARDEAWREAVEAMRKPLLVLPCSHTEDDACACHFENTERKRHNTALDALLSRMDGAK